MRPKSGKEKVEAVETGSFWADGRIYHHSVAGGDPYRGGEEQPGE